MSTQPDELRHELAFMTADQLSRACEDGEAFPRGRACEARRQRDDLFLLVPELLAELRKASELMPLGTAKRADWLKRVGELLAKTEGRA